MGLSATELATTAAGQFNVSLRFYAGPLFETLLTGATLHDYVQDALPTGWASADAPGAGWTEITSRVYAEGSLAEDLQGSGWTWKAELQGEDYDGTYLGVGRALLALRQIAVGATTHYTWGLWFLGMVTGGNDKDDYRHGGAWQRSVQGLDVLLRLDNAPRLTAGPVNLASTTLGASASATSELSPAALEAGNGEFFGATANVDAENVLDENLNTVWISTETPSATGETPATPGHLVIDKVFFKPIAGYAGFWWLELFNDDPARLDFVESELWLRNEDDVYVAGKWGASNGQYSLEHGERGIVTNDRSLFEEYNGENHGAQWILEAQSWSRRGEGVPWGALDGDAFTLNTTAGHVTLGDHAVTTIRDVVAWNQTGADPGLTGWTGGAINISTLTDGYCLRRKPTGTDAGGAADWYFEPFYEPGSYLEPGTVAAVLVELPPRETLLTADVLAAATTLPVSDTSGWPTPRDGLTHQGECEGDDFTYTGRTTATLTGVVGLTLPHSTGAALYPMVAGVRQTGWPVAEIGLQRRNGATPAGAALAVIKDWRIYIDRTGATSPRLPTESGWEADYDTNYKSGKGNTGYTITTAFTGPIESDGLLAGYRWMRAFLVYIMAMSDAGRAKLNGVWARLAQAQVASSGLGDLDSLQSKSLARYLAVTSFGLEAAAFHDGTIPTTYGLIGNHATAIAPYWAVLEDLARRSGCLVRVRRDSHLAWRPDPWWPLGQPSADLTPRALLGSEHVRDEVSWRSRRPGMVGVVVKARSPDGSEVFSGEFPPGAAAAGPVSELTDYVCASALEAQKLAEALWRREGGIDYATMGSAVEADLTLVGPGEWCLPGQWVQLCHSESDNALHPIGDVATYGATGWMVQRVSWRWRRDDWTCELALKRFTRN